MARKIRSPALMSTLVWSYRAWAIWEATARFQISSYSRRWDGSRWAVTTSGVRATAVGRIPSWASWACLALALYWVRLT